jgi:hypothetical protein
MEQYAVRYPTVEYRRAQPGSKGLNKHYKAHRIQFFGHKGILKTSFQTIHRNASVGQYTDQRGIPSFAYKIPNGKMYKAAPQMDKLPRGGNVPRVVGTVGDEFNDVTGTMYGAITMSNGQTKLMGGVPLRNQGDVPIAGTNFTVQPTSQGSAQASTATEQLQLLQNNELAQDAMNADQALREQAPESYPSPPPERPDNGLSMIHSIVSGGRRAIQYAQDAIATHTTATQPEQPYGGQRRSDPATGGGLNEGLAFNNDVAITVNPGNQNARQEHFQPPPSARQEQTDNNAMEVDQQLPNETGVNMASLPDANDQSSSSSNYQSAESSSVVSPQSDGHYEVNAMEIISQAKTNNDLHEVAKSLGLIAPKKKITNHKSLKKFYTEQM